MMRSLPAVLLLLASCASHPLAVPLQPPAPPLAAWSPSLHLAETALSSGAPVIALQVTDQLLVRNPADVDALVRRGDALVALGRPSDAMLSYNTAIGLQGDNAKALIGLGRLRLVQDPAGAEALFARVVVLAPRDVAALSNLGIARDLQGHHREAQEAYRQALGVAPTAGAVLVNLGLSLALSGDAPGAVRLLQPLATAPDSTPRVRQNLALALTLNGRRGEATGVLGRDMPPEQVRVALDGFEALRP